MTAYEIGYTGVIRNRAHGDARPSTGTTPKDGIFFTPVASTRRRIRRRAGRCRRRSSTVLAQLNPPVVAAVAFTYLNLGKVKDKGIELGVDAAVNRYVNVFANYSYQWMPVVEELPAGTSIDDINWPAEEPLQRRLQLQLPALPRQLSVNYTDEAYWQDVLDVRFAGHDRRLHAGQRRVRRALGRRQARRPASR